MDDQTSNKDPQSRGVTSHNNPVGDASGAELEDRRSVNNLPNRGSTGGGPPSVPGSSGGTETGRSVEVSRPTNVALSQMLALAEHAGEEPFGDGVVSILSAPIEDTIVDIRPDGLIYVSHNHYRDRLDQAFGVGGWALIPLDRPAIKDNRVVYWGFLKAHGQYIADAVGGASYYPNNRQGSYDNSVEAAKSDCLVRCCKALPLYRQCWDRDYSDWWKATYAVARQQRSGRGEIETIWTKKPEYRRGINSYLPKLKEITPPEAGPEDDIPDFAADAREED